MIDCLILLPISGVCFVTLLGSKSLEQTYHCQMFMGNPGTGGMWCYAGPVRTLDTKLSDKDLENGLPICSVLQMNHALQFIAYGVFKNDTDFDSDEETT